MLLVQSCFVLHSHAKMIIANRAFLSQKRSIRFLTALTFALALALAFRGLLSGYSYWLDELHSVISSSGSWEFLYKKAIVNDVHPPLYQILLRLWILLVGSNAEVPVRFLSFIFAVITLIAFGAKSYIDSSINRVFALALVGFSPIFSYYSQEARSYSLVLALSSVVTLSLIQIRSQSRNQANSQIIQEGTLELLFYFGCLALSLTHYFGWIYVVVILLLRAVLNEISGDRIKSLVMFSLISVEPILHFLIGGLGGSTGGDFWIKVTPPILGTINSYLQGCLPLIAFSGTPYTVISAWTLLIGFVLIAVGSWKSLIRFLNPISSSSPIIDESRFLLYLIATMLLIVSLVDLRLPMSTARNFIVLLPPTMLLVSNLLVLLAESGDWTNLRSATSLLFSAVVLSLLLIKSYRGLGEKIFPSENWKQLSAYVRGSGVCADGCTARGSFGLHSYYFDGINSISYTDNLDLAPIPESSDNGVEASPVPSKNIPSFPLLGFHNESEHINDYLASNSGLVCLQPSQGSPNRTFILLPARSLTGSEAKFGMVKCL